MNQFSTWTDRRGNLWMAGGGAIAWQGGEAVTFELPVAPTVAFVRFGAADEMLPADGRGGIFCGWSGSNLVLGSGPDPAVPSGFFLPADGERFLGPGGWSIYLDGTDSILHDGTDAVAELTGSSVPSWSGTYTATAYGETTYNGGSAWTIDVTEEGGPWNRSAVVSAPTSTAQEGTYVATGLRSWESADDSDWTITLDATGAGEWSDGTDVVATRAADATRLDDPSGTWTATAYGAATYGPEGWWQGLRSDGTFADHGFTFLWTAAGVDTYVADASTAVVINVDTINGTAALADAGGTVAEKSGGLEGVYTSTTYGTETYGNGGEPWTYTVSEDAEEPTVFSAQITLLRGQPKDGWLYVLLGLDSGTGELTGITGPFVAVTMPAATTTALPVPVASMVDGKVKPYHSGPIFWVPPASAGNDHNYLTNLQGGKASEYYHLTAAEQAAVATLQAQILTRSLGA